MASLELIPHPPVLAAQAVIFLVNVLVVKKLFVEPYFRVKDRRDKLTTGGKDDATRVLGEAEVMSAKINERLQSTYDAAKAEREKIRAAALAKRDTVLAVADRDTKTQIEAVSRQIQADLEQEKAKIPAVVAQLTDEVYRIALA